MCGRYLLTVSGKAVCELFGLPEETRLAPRYNIAPGQTAPVVRIEDGGRRLINARWGLVPPWARDPSIGNRLINARSETVASKPSFRAAFRSRRCLVPADGFYEWKREGGARHPYCIRFSDHRPFAIAGLWERWRSPAGDILDTYTLLTTGPNALVKPLHERMPVIVTPDAYSVWLDPHVNDPETLLPLFEPYPPDGMEARPASRLVNNPRNEGPACLDAHVAQ